MSKMIPVPENVVEACYELFRYRWQMYAACNERGYSIRAIAQAFSVTPSTVQFALASHRPSAKHFQGERLRVYLDPLSGTETLKLG